MKRMRTARRWLAPVGAAHRGLLIGGLGFTMATVLLRLAMPWPLRGFMHVAAREIRHPGSVPPHDPWHLHDPVVLALLFVAIVVVLGWTEMHQRILLKRYATESVHRLRAVAVAAAGRRRHHHVADLVSRIIADSARLKSELTGILVHGLQSALYYLGIVVVFLFVSRTLAGILLLGGLYSFIVGYRAMLRVATVARKQREREGRYAATLAHLDADPRRAQEINTQSASKDVKTTRLIMRASWAVHVGFALLTAAALLVSLREVRTGHMESGDLFLLIAYALTAHRRLVHMGRQLARWGKVDAHTSRIVELIESAPRRSLASEALAAQMAGDEVGLAPLTGALRLDGIRLGRRTADGQRRRLRRTDLLVPAGTKVAVVGRAQSGRSALLRVLAGQAIARGCITWNDRPVRARDLATSPEVRFLPATPLFGRERLASLLGVEGTGGLEPHSELVAALGIDRIVAEASRGLETKLSSSDLTRVETRAILLFDWLRQPTGSLWLLDDPVEGLARRKAKTWIDLIVRRAGTRTVVLGLTKLDPRVAFDRVHYTRKRQLTGSAL